MAALAVTVTVERRRAGGMTSHRMGRGRSAVPAGAQHVRGLRGSGEPAEDVGEVGGLEPSAGVRGAGTSSSLNCVCVSREPWGVR